MALDLEALKAEFAARGGKATRVESGVRALTPADLRRASGYEPETVKLYNVTLCGEDGGIWTERVPGRSAADAADTAQQTWPESQINEVRRA